MKVNTIMTTDVAFCKGDAKLDQVARLMADYDCSGIPVVDDENHKAVIGILTERDIIQRALAKGLNPADMTASTCMTKYVFVAKEDSDIDECLRTMEEHHVRRLPIIDENRACCGIVTLTNLAEYLPAPTIGEVLKEISAPNRHHTGKSAQPSSSGRLAPPNEANGLYGFQTIDNLPTKIKRQLPAPAQQIYFDAYNSAIKDLTDASKPAVPEIEIAKAATKVAWARVEGQFQKKGEKWIPKSP